MVAEAGIVTGDTLREPSLASWFLAMKAEERKMANFSNWPKLDTLFENPGMRSQRLGCLRSVSSKGSKGAFVSSLSTTEMFQLRRFLELLG